MTLLVQGCPGSIRLVPAPANIGLMTDILPVASDNYEEDESVVNKKRSRQTILYEGILKGDSDQRCHRQGRRRTCPAINLLAISFSSILNSIQANYLGDGVNNSIDKS